MLHQLVATGPKRKYGLHARALEDGKLAKKTRTNGRQSIHLQRPIPVHVKPLNEHFDFT